MKTPTLISANTLAEYAGVTRRRIDQIVENGYLTRENGKFEFPRCIQQLIAYYQRDENTLKAEKMLQIQERRQQSKEKHERDQWCFEQKRGKYIADADAILATSTYAREAHGVVRARLERNLPLERRDKLIELQVAGAAVGAFYEWDIKLGQALVDEIEAEYKRIEEIKSEDIKTTIGQ